MKKVAIIGAGRIGNAIGKVLRNVENDVLLWDKDPQKCSAADIESVVIGSDFLFFCVPSWSLREAAESVRKFINEKTILISLTKGIEKETLKTANEILKEILPKSNIVILGGPLLSENIQNNEIGIAVTASAKKEILAETKKIFSNTNIFIEPSDNPKAVALAGVLKNIYATSMGIAQGCGLADNFLGYLAARSIEEMGSISKNISGGDKEITLGTAGAGDFIATSFSENSNNRKSGIEMVQSGSAPQSEGIASFPSLSKLLGRDCKNFKLLSALTEIIENKKDPKTILINLLNR